MEKEKELVITREFDFPREKVWGAWTDPEKIKKWWGPKDFTAPHINLDFRVGGRYLFCMRGRGAPGAPVRDYWSTGTYREIAMPNRLVMTDSFADEKGNVVPATHYGMSRDFPPEMLVTVMFEEDNGKTRLTLRHDGMPLSDIEGARQGWSQSFDKLAESLKLMEGAAKNKTKITAEPGKQEMLIVREFDAPRELVFRAYTDPEIYAKWIGPRRLTTALEKFEPENGGSWRYISKDEDGNEFAFHGVNHEVLPPERIIGTFEFEGLPEKGHVLLQTVKFEALTGERTRVTSQSVFQSVEDRDGMIQSGMEWGVNESHERLDEILEKMKKEESYRFG